MNVLLAICWSVPAAGVAWRLSRRRADAAIAMLRADASREIRYWQAHAERARSRAAQLERELASWSDGCRQGREDVVSIMPLLLAAQGHQACLQETGTDSSS